MKYQLIKWLSGSESIYEITDDYKQERLIWHEGNKSNKKHNWEPYTDPRKIGIKLSQVKWLTQEEVFAYML